MASKNDDVRKNERKIEASLKGLETLSEKAVNRAVVGAALDIQRAAKKLAPVDTGRLQNSIAVAEKQQALARNSDQATEKREARNEINATMTSAVIGTNLNYAQAVEFGSRPHHIRPKNAEALHFEVGGEKVFATQVQHPGTPARPYMTPAFKIRGKELEKRLKRELKKAAKDTKKEAG